MTAVGDAGQHEAGEQDLQPGPDAGAGRDPFRLRGEPAPVMRLSRKALAIAGGATGLAIAGALVYALQPVRHASGELHAAASDPRPSELVAGAPADYARVPRLGEPLPGDLGRPILAARQSGADAPLPPVTPPAARPVDPAVAAAREAQLRLGQEQEAARSSKLFLQAAAASASPPLAQARAGAGADAPAGDTRRAFMARQPGRASASAARIEAPGSMRTLLAGSVIPAALITGIRSDLPGQIAAQVTQNVYDSATGRILLIPQGSRLLGEYDSEVAAGQSRVLLAWDRLILPGGESIRLDRQPGTDGSGFAGLADATNYHWGRMLKAAAISTLLGVGTELGTSGQDALTKALRSGVQDSVSQTGRQIVQRELAVPPTITIRPGFPVRVLITSDLVFEPASPGTRP